MDKEIAMKQHVLELLKQFLMGHEGERFKPKAIEVQMIGKKPGEEEEPQELADGGEVFDTQGETGWADGEEHGLDIEHNMHETEGENETFDNPDETGWESAEDKDLTDEEGKKPKMSLKDFLASRA